ncbi:MAG: beta-phosphoglucomutase, partial [Candidatus Izemoplasmatales bacterium]
IIGNGFFGYRGTLEEYSRDQMVSLNMAGLYDQNGTKWRESVNAFNPLYTYLKVNGNMLNPLKITPTSHTQGLDMEVGTHYRKTTFTLDDTEITITSERFSGQANYRVLVMKYSFFVNKPVVVDLLTGIDTSVYDINGPHLENMIFHDAFGSYTVVAETVENKYKLAVSEIVKCDFSAEDETLLINGLAMRRFRVNAEPDQIYSIYKYVGIEHTWADSEEKARSAAIWAAEQGYENLCNENIAFWKQKWNFSDIEIKGDAEAQLAIRNSIYHLIIVRPWSEYRGIPIRGLSGQVYKGSVAWDTEIFMLPFYLNTDLDSARKIIMYRIHTLEGAMRKANSYGYKGAFYALESQDTGDDACTDFNVTDAETGTPIRTSVKEQQIHISADVVYAIDRYVSQTNDHTVLIDGGLRTIIECARFYQSYVSFSLEKNCYEVRNVVGPDEYHEGVNNNAYTNKMISATFASMIRLTKMVRGIDNNWVNELIREYDYETDIEAIKVIAKALYVPKPDENHIIEQFDGYHLLENIQIDDLKKRMKHPNEYLGGAHGLATPTQIIKQADVVTMITTFRDDYSKLVKMANWKYYEPRTEHFGPSLSSAMYALLGCEIGEYDYAFAQFMQCATIDLNGESRSYSGGIYVGGTHPAASGGAYMDIVYGFAGIKHLNGLLSGDSRLPKRITELRFKCTEMGKVANVSIKTNGVRITWEKRKNIQAVIFDLDGVIVSTDHMHYQAWKKIADRENIPFNRTINKKLLGVSRMESLEIILKKAERKYTQIEKNNMAAFKNAEYINLLSKLTTKDILPGVAVTFAFLKSKRIKIAGTSGSQNAALILQQTNLGSAFDVFIDGNDVSTPKPNPEVFLRAAAKLEINPENCLVVDDAMIGIQAAKGGGMFAAGISEAEDSPMCDWKLKELTDLINLF